MNTHAGYIAILGRPNVGKSTLLNKILGTKLSITSKKAQTTRNRILGIKTLENHQAIYVDTPGIHEHSKRALNRLMVQSAIASLEFVNVAVFMIDARYWKPEDEIVFQHLRKKKLPLIVVLNKIDRLKDINSLLPQLEKIQKRFNEAGFEQVEFLPISAKTEKNVELLEKLILEKLPTSPFFYDEDDLTDKSIRFLCGEIIREKMLRLLGEEVPHDAAIEIEFYKESEKLIDISAVIWLNRPGQKKIVIGENGLKLKEIGSKARVDIENLVSKKVMLRLWVKVRKNWADDDRALRSLGYYDE